MNKSMFLVVCTLSLVGFAGIADSKNPTKPVAVAAAGKVFFVSPKDGETVGKKVKIKFGINGMEVKKAGAVDATSGHHHLIIDGQALKKGEIVPKDAKNLHYGDGQTETEIELTPGSHKLTMQFADGAHKSLGEEMSATISVNVK